MAAKALQRRVEALEQHSQHAVLHIIDCTVKAVLTEFERSEVETLIGAVESDLVHGDLAQFTPAQQTASDKLNSLLMRQRIDERLDEIRRSGSTSPLIIIDR